MNEIENTNKTFEDIKHIDEEGCEFWYARELQHALNYKEWRNFKNVINKAINVCRIINSDVLDHFVSTDKIVEAGVATKKIEDYKLSRYACYLIIQNANPRLKTVSLCQTYLAMKTMSQELFENEFRT